MPLHGHSEVQDVFENRRKPPMLENAPAPFLFRMLLSVLRFLSALRDSAPREFLVSDGRKESYVFVCTEGNKQSCSTSALQSKSPLLLKAFPVVDKVDNTGTRYCSQTSIRVRI